MALPPPDERRRASVREIERLILARIARGDYPAGTRLPTCEQLGRELRANKNTISKAYQALARQGFTVSRPAHGTFVAMRPAPADGAGTAIEVRRLLEEAVVQAGLSGLSADELEALAVDTIRRTYRRATVRVGYVDCCRPDARELGRALQLGLSTSVEPLVIGDITGDDGSAADAFDLLAVNLAHLGAVERRLRRADRPLRVEIVPVVAHPDSGTLTQVARLPAGTRLLVVTDTDDMLNRLTGLARGVSPLAQVSGALSTSAHLADALDAADAVLVTRTAHRRVAALASGKLTIVTGFKFDQSSVQDVATRLAKLLHASPAADRGLSARAVLDTPAARAASPVQRRVPQRNSAGDTQLTPVES